MADGRPAGFSDDIFRGRRRARGRPRMPLLSIVELFSFFKNDHGHGLSKRRCVDFNVGSLGWLALQTRSSVDIVETKSKAVALQRLEF